MIQGLAGAVLGALIFTTTIQCARTIGFLIGLGENRVFRLRQSRILGDLALLAIAGYLLSRFFVKDASIDLTDLNWVPFEYTFHLSDWPWVLAVAAPLLFWYGYRDYNDARKQPLRDGGPVITLSRTAIGTTKPFDRRRHFDLWLVTEVKGIAVFVADVLLGRIFAERIRWQSHFDEFNQRRQDPAHDTPPPDDQPRPGPTIPVAAHALLVSFLLLWLPRWFPPLNDLVENVVVRGPENPYGTSLLAELTTVTSLPFALTPIDALTLPAIGLAYVLRSPPVLFRALLVTLSAGYLAGAYLSATASAEVSLWAVAGPLPLVLTLARVAYCHRLRPRLTAPTLSFEDNLASAFSLLWVFGGGFLLASVVAGVWGLTSFSPRDAPWFDSYVDAVGELLAAGLPAVVHIVLAGVLLLVLTHGRCGEAFRTVSPWAFLSLAVPVVLLISGHFRWIIDSHSGDRRIDYLPRGTHRVTGEESLTGPEPIFWTAGPLLVVVAFHLIMLPVVLRRTGVGRLPTEHPAASPDRVPPASAL